MSLADVERILVINICLSLLGLSCAGVLDGSKASGDPYKELFNPSGIRGGDDDRGTYVERNLGPYDWCQPTDTEILGEKACGKRIIFDETFHWIAGGIWRREYSLPINHPEYPYVLYHHDTVSTANGNLRIAPMLLTNLTGFTNESITSGMIDLTGKCTSSGNACFRQASGLEILPPIVSGRINTRDRFSFKYGIVTIRAKLPQGDWLYPEILLEPHHKDFGDGFASGVIKIASARGNIDLYSGLNDYGNNVLYGGPVMDFECHDDLLVSKILRKQRKWGDDFHEFVLRWEPESITLSVDGEEYAWIEPTSTGLHSRLSNNCTKVQHKLLSHGGSMAPFNEYFYITLGVTAGGVTEFPDNVNTKGSHPKPWRNGARKAMYNFWQDIDNWYQTWNEPEMLVDYIKVQAL